MNRSSFQVLPQDLKAAIFEYVPLQDYATLALVCQDFHFILQKNSDLWARHLFGTFLDIISKEIPFSDEDFFGHTIALDQSKIQFTNMTDSQNLLVKHHIIMKQWKFFFRPFLHPDDCQIFLDEVFDTLARPLPPPPYLKKDTQYFPTNTLFQNFLTEVHFGVHGRPMFQEKKQNFIEEIASGMKGSLQNQNVNKDNLVAVRWYMFSKEKSNSNADIGVDKLSSLKFRSQVIQKKHIGFRKRVSLEKFKSSISKQISSKIQNAKSVLKKREKKAKNSQSKVIQRKRETIQQPKKVGGNSVEEFYRILHELITNYCKMVFTYLQAIRDPYLLLSEYTRLWNRFTLLIMDFSQTFSPFTKLFNTLYEEICKGLPHFPEFSTWRLMVKIWISQVFSNLSCFLGEGFRSILMKVRTQKKSSFVKKAEGSQNCSFCCKMQRNSDDSNGLFDKFFYKIQRSQRERTDISVDDLRKLLKGFYSTVDDLSYNEFSIFYWDCGLSDKRTPKGILNSLVLQDTKVFYEYCKECFWQDTDHYEKFLRDDSKFLKKIFGKQFCSELRQTQASVIKEFLVDKFNKAVQEVNSFRELKLGKRRKSLGCSVNLKELLKFVSIDDELQKTILETKQKKELITTMLEKDGRLLNSYMSYLLKEQEEMESQMLEFEEMKGLRVLRGFLVADDRYKRFFELGQNPSLGEIHKVGMEGKDIKEEVELAEEDIIFL